METNPNHFDTYYQVQYDRIDKLEYRRETYSNFIITITIGLSVLNFSYFAASNNYLKWSYFGLLFFLNFSAVLFHLRTRQFVKMHQNRAKLVLRNLSPKIYWLEKSIPKPNSDKDIFGRHRIYIGLHIILVLFAIITSLLPINKEIEIPKTCCCMAQNK